MIAVPQKFRIYAALCLTGLAVSGCSYGEDIRTVLDDMRFYPSFLNSGEASTDQDPAQKQKDVGREKYLNPYLQDYKWWMRYEDPLLNDLVDELMAQNLDLKAAGERLIQSRENIAIQYGAFLPAISADGSAQRSATPTGSSLRSGAAASAGGATAAQGPDTIYNTYYDVGLSASWQLDLFGQLRNQLQSAEALYKASVEERRALAQSLIVELVRQRVQISNLAAQIELTKNTIASRQRTLDTISRRYELGSTSSSALSVYLARENLAAAKADLPALSTAYENAIYALEILLGKMPGTMEDTDLARFSLMPPPERLSVPPPMALLDRRPDLRANEYRLVAAEEDIDVAVANLFPTLSISGGYGYQSSEFNTLISSEQIAWNLLGNVTAPLFEGRRLRANIRLQEAEARELAANYAKEILTAMQEVEGALLNEENQRLRHSLLSKQSSSSQSSYDIAQRRYERGVFDLTEVLDIERRLFISKLQVLQTKADIWNARLDLILALGGDWMEILAVIPPGKPVLPPLPYAPEEPQARSSIPVPAEPEEEDPQEDISGDNIPSEALLRSVDHKPGYELAAKPEPQIKPEIDVQSEGQPEENSKNKQDTPDTNVVPRPVKSERLLRYQGIINDLP